MSKIELKVPESLNGARLDKALGELAPGLTRAKTKRAIESRAVRVDGRVRVKGALVSTGEVITIDEEAIEEADGPPTADKDAPLEVRYESPQVLVVDKPAGQPTAPLRAGELGTLVNALVGRYPELHGVGYTAREPGLVHRLDTDTSGLVVVARTKEAFEMMKAAIKDDRLEKTYLLVCSGEDLPDEGTIEFPLAKHPKDQRRVYPCVHPRDVQRYEPRPASTRYEVVERKGRWALVRAHVARALRHQIRAHFAAIDHPLAGDILYGGPEIRALGRHALHAATVRFKGDAAIPAFEVTSALPAEMAQLLKAAESDGALPVGSE